MMRARLEEHGLMDVHDVLNRASIKYIFTSTRGARTHRVDRVYVGKVTMKRIHSYKIIPNHFSDHDGVEVLLTWGHQLKWGKGVWKLNADILRTRFLMTELERK